MHTVEKQNFGSQLEKNIIQLEQQKRMFLRKFLIPLPWVTDSAFTIFIPFMMLCTSFRLPLILLRAEELSPSLNFMSIQNFKSSIEDF